jgi:TRAP-type mannitol/chloroaromatic compound transport system permease small subunit
MKDLSDLIIAFISFALTSMVIGAIVFLLWNACMPNIFNVPRVTYIEATCLYALASILTNKITIKK